MRPAQPCEHIECRLGNRRGKRTDQLIEPEFPDIVGRRRTRTAGARLEFGELQLRDPDRILITHAQSHQPGDFAEHRVVDALPADEALHTIHVKLRVA